MLYYNSQMFFNFLLGVKRTITNPTRSAYPGGFLNYFEKWSKVSKN